jgi:hypothetical protein
VSPSGPESAVVWGVRLLVFRFALLLLVGWGLGWFIARSHLGGLVVREPLDDASARAIARARARGGWVWLPAAAILGFVSGMVQCAGCSGFWLGLGLGCLWPLPAVPGLAGVLATGFAVMGCNALLDAITGAHAARERLAWLEHERLQREVAVPELPESPRLAPTRDGQ